jgi:hypothetical protein
MKREKNTISKSGNLKLRKYKNILKVVILIEDNISKRTINLEMKFLKNPKIVKKGTLNTTGIRINNNVIMKEDW